MMNIYQLEAYPLIIELSGGITMDNIWTIEVLREDGWERFSSEKTYTDDDKLTTDLKLLKEHGFKVRAVEFRRVNNEN